MVAGRTSFEYTANNDHINILFLLKHFLITVFLSLQQFPG